MSVSRKCKFLKLGWDFRYGQPHHLRQFLQHAAAHNEQSRLIALPDATDEAICILKYSGHKLQGKSSG